MRTMARSTRPYLAGFGTSGSLLAGAAVLFVLASAIVAFRGWPQIATGPATTNVSASQPVAPSHITRRLAAVLRTRPAVRGGAAAAAAGARRFVRRIAARSVGRTPGKGRATTATPNSGTGPSAGSAGANAAGAGGACGGSGCQQTLTTGVTTTVAKQVNDIGTAVGSLTQSTVSAVAGTVSGVSPQAGSTVQGPGQEVGNTVSGTTNTVVNVLTNAGSALGGGH